MPDDKLPANKAHGTTYRFVFDPRARTDPRSIGLIRGSYRYGMVLAPPFIVAADSPHADQVLNEGDEIEVAEDDLALLYLVENTHKHLFRYCTPKDIRPSDEEWAKIYTAGYIAAERKAGRGPTLTGLRQTALDAGKSGVRELLDKAFRKQHEVKRGRRKKSAE
jgi:hypothetical protein